MKLLKFSEGNAKLSSRLVFSLPAGYTCPHAGVCKTFADRVTGKITDLPQLNKTLANDYRCFAAMSETRPNVRNARWHNWDLIRTAMYNKDGNAVDNICNLIDLSLALSPYYDLIRVHESGDFWTEQYMKAWFKVAKCRPNQTFYAYTKSLGMWLALKDEVPTNFYLTASCGGTLDYLLHSHKDIFKRIAYVVYTEEEAAHLNLAIDHDDSHCLGNKPFALLVHSSQRAGSAASKALSQRKKLGKFVGYHKEKLKVA